MTVSTLDSFVARNLKHLLCINFQYGGIWAREGENVIQQTAIKTDDKNGN